MPVHWSLLADRSTDRLPDDVIRRHVGHHLIGPYLSGLIRPDHLILIDSNELLLLSLLLSHRLMPEQYALLCPVRVRDDLLLVADHLLPRSDWPHPDLRHL